MIRSGISLTPDHLPDQISGEIQVKLCPAFSARLNSPGAWSDLAAAALPGLLPHNPFHISQFRFLCVLTNVSQETLDGLNQSRACITCLSSPSSLLLFAAATLERLEKAWNLPWLSSWRRGVLQLSVLRLAIRSEKSKFMHSHTCRYSTQLRIYAEKCVNATKLLSFWPTALQ